jgi:NAD-dependent SIR2 family protein deacetylase
MAEHREALDRAARVIDQADALLVAAGAGMGVDSGLPDFRGNQGFWNAYPPFERLGLSFVDMANPGWFERDPELAWGFYGHRLDLYRTTRPHEGFDILRRWGEARPGGQFVFTSNVDGQFQSAGYADVGMLECHGSIHHFQCATPCSDEIWEDDAVAVTVDPETFRAAPPLPSCPSCGGVARPNVLMFGDWGWLPARTAAQQQAFEAWLRDLSSSHLAIVEIGAGTAVPTVRMTSESLVARHGATLVRINPREAHVPHGQIAVAGPALENLQTIDQRLGIH